MDKVNKYRQIVKEIIYDVANTGTHLFQEVQSFVIEDEKKGHYLLFSDGWVEEEKRFYGCSIHIGVKDNGKVYLYHDGTDLEIGQQMLDAGVLPNDLVPAFQPPSVREEMGFAVI